MGRRLCMLSGPSLPTTRGYTISCYGKSRSYHKTALTCNNAFQTDIPQSDTFLRTLVPGKNPKVE